MAYDLLFGPCRRDFSRAPSADLELARSIASPPVQPVSPAGLAHDVSADLARFYDQYHPSYSQHVFSIRTKTDLLKGESS